MFSKYFISTLVFIIVSLVVLFQGEIKEGFSHVANQTNIETELPELSLSPEVYKHLPTIGLVPKPYFSGWQGNGAQFLSVETDPFTDKYGNPIAHVSRTLGYDTAAMYKSPPPKRTLPLPPRAKHIPSRFTTKERFTPVGQFDTIFDNVQVEAARNMQPLTGGPPRFNNNQSPHLNLTYPIDNAKYAVDPDHPIVNYGGDLYASDGQLQKMNLDTREDFGQSKGNSGGRSIPTNMISLDGQPSQPVIIDRVGMPALMVNAKSRLQIGGVDRIRGDIDIVPSLYMSDGIGKGGYKEREFSKWFQVSVKPHRDLVSGYIPQHTIRGAEFGAHAAASGIDPQLLSTRVDNIDTARAIVDFRDPTAIYSAMPTFGSSMGGRQNATEVRYGTDIAVDSYGI